MFAFHDPDGLIINYDRGGDKFFKYKPYDLKKNSHLYQKYGIIDHYERFRQEHLSEERRIWYVAVTRARQLLYLSTPELIDGDLKQGSAADFFQEIHDAFANAGTICQFRSFKEESDEDQAELPLWKGRDKAAFRSLEEAEEYGEQLIALARYWLM